MNEIIEVNGIKYISKEQKQPKMSKSLLSLFAMGMMMGGNIFGGTKEPKKPNVDIVKEYGLIQNKKSTLTRSQRDWVVWQFEKTFTKITKKTLTNKTIKNGNNCKI